MDCQDDGTEAAVKVLHTWILNSQIRYSSSGQDGAVPAIKLLYRVIGQAEADGMLGTINCDSQEINMPQEAIAEIQKALEGSNALLPEKDKTFEDWKVGLLERWDGDG